MAEYCDDGRFAIRRTVWLLQNQYRPIPGKVLGQGAVSTINGWLTFKNQYGGQFLVTNNEMIRQISQQGHDISLFMSGIGVMYSGYQFAVDEAISLGIRLFYVDEPIQNYGKMYPPYPTQDLRWDSQYWDPLKNWVQTLAQYIQNKGVGATLSMSESNFDPTSNWRIEYLANLVLGTNPNPFAGCHTHFEDHPWPVPDIDPRPQWDLLRSRVGSLFNFAWIKTRQTPTEMGLLFGHANNLGGISKIIYWPANDRENDRVDLASDQGWRSAWLQRLEKEREDRYCCPTQTYDPEVCELESSVFTGNQRWV
jgi:hypothetical protein